MKKQVKDIMTKNPDCCGPETMLQEAASNMCRANCGEIPVLDAYDKPIGVITDRDITCRSVAKGVNPLDFRVKDCMSSPCITVKENASLEECCALMEEHQIRRIPVIDKDGRCCGIVSQADIALKASKEKTAEVLHEVSKKTHSF